MLSKLSRSRGTAYARANPATRALKAALCFQLHRSSVVPMAHPASPKSIADLRTFLFEKVLNEDPLTHSITLLGSFPENGGNSINRVQAIIRIDKTVLDIEDAKHFFEPSGLLDRVNFEEGTDIVPDLPSFLLIAD